MLLMCGRYADDYSESPSNPMRRLSGNAWPAGREGWEWTRGADGMWTAPLSLTWCFPQESVGVIHLTLSLLVGTTWTARSHWTPRTNWGAGLSNIYLSFIWVLCTVFLGTKFSFLPAQGPSGRPGMTGQPGGVGEKVSYFTDCLYSTCCSVCLDVYTFL